MIKPSWETVEDPQGRRILEIDPASSFGTGSHDTTQLCMMALEDAVKPGDKLLDMGTGSGILAIAALVTVVVNFGVLQQYRRLDKAQAAYDRVHTQYVSAQEALADYDRVLLEYRTYSMDWMTAAGSEDIPAAVDRQAALDLLEQEGAEDIVPDLMDFLNYCVYNAGYKHEFLGGTWRSAKVGDLAVKAIARIRRPAIQALKASRRFDPPLPIAQVAEYAKPFLSVGNQYGEGWFLAGEMAELITSGTPNIVCIQPFACLPNHVVGKGVIKALRAAYPGANIVAVDYDPGASEVNQLNRIKLMLTAAQRALHAQEATPKKPQPPEAPSISLPHPKVAML